MALKDQDTESDVLDPESDSGSPPETDDESPADDPQASPSDDEGTPPSEDDDEPKEWQSLEKKFENIEDERERRRAIGKQYWEKTRYASEVRKENEALKRQLEEAKESRLSEARREQPKDDDEPPPPHPDLERLDFRIDTLSEKDKSYYEEQQKLLVSVNKTDQDVAAVKAKIEDADEYTRAVLEQRLEGLEYRKQNLVDRFNDLHDRREDLGYRLDELQQQRTYVERVVSDRERQEQDERQSLEEFSREFPGQVSRTIDELADAAGLDPEDESLRTDLKETVRDRLTVKFWRLGQGQEADDSEIEDMIKSEVSRYIKSRDLAGRAKFGKTSKEKLSVSGKRPAPARRKTSEDEGAPPPRPRGYEDEPKDVSALGTVSQSPSMMRARQYLRRRGL
jgi:hypothetical protein